MRDTMAHLNGAGLAAPQIGVPLRVVIFGVTANPRYPDIEEVPDTVLINPGARRRSRTRWRRAGKGCLSVPGMRGWVPRFRRLKYSGFDEHGKRVRARGRKASTPAWCSTRSTTSTAFSTRCASATSRRFGFNEALFPGANLPPED